MSSCRMSRYSWQRMGKRFSNWMLSEKMCFINVLNNIFRSEKSSRGSNSWRQRSKQPCSTSMTQDFTKWKILPSHSITSRRFGWKPALMEFVSWFWEMLSLILKTGGRSWKRGKQEVAPNPLGKQHPALCCPWVWGKDKIMTKNCQKFDNGSTSSIVFQRQDPGKSTNLPLKKVEGSGLYPKIARINHSCAPNAIWTWLAKDRSRWLWWWKQWQYWWLSYFYLTNNLSRRRKEVRACRQIRKGDEVGQISMHWDGGNPLS